MSSPMGIQIDGSRSCPILLRHEKATVFFIAQYMYIGIRVALSGFPWFRPRLDLKHLEYQSLMLSDLVAIQQSVYVKNTN